MHHHPVFPKARIFAPGPTPIPQQVLSSMAEPVMHHRTKPFEKILTSTRKGLGFLFQTQQPVHILAASGTGGMEMAVVNLFSEGDTVLTINGGKFGQRWGKLCRGFGLEVLEHEVEWGSAVDPGDVKKALQNNPHIKGVLFQASETSTGVAHPTEELARVIQENSDALIVVDAITALGVMDIPMDKWGLDAVITGSQKALMLPPGLAFLSLSSRARKQAETSSVKKFYFDIRNEEKALATGQTAWTPAVSLIGGLDIVLQGIQETGLEPLFEYHEVLSLATRNAAEAMGLELLAKSHHSPAVTAIKIPDSISEGKKVVSHLQERFSITIAGGQDHLKGKIFRIGHLGYYDNLDMITVLSAVEMTLDSLGHHIELGSGVGAALKTFQNHLRNQ